jgi:hypothetical protein
MRIFVRVRLLFRTKMSVDGQLCKQQLLLSVSKRIIEFAKRTAKSKRGVPIPICEEH